MPLPATSSKTKAGPALVIAGALVLMILVLGVLYLRRPTTNQPADAPASAEAKAYVSNLRLSDVNMHATENFMKQQVVEIEGKIANDGPRALKSVDVFCLFFGIDGREIHRERVPIVKPAGSPLKPKEERRFRLPFDTLPDGWNEAMPRMVIANISFAS